MSKVEATWHGDDSLPEGCAVVILAVDYADPAVPSRRACWIRHWPEGSVPSYRSCDLDDLGLTDDQLAILNGSAAEEETMWTTPQTQT